MLHTAIWTVPRRGERRHGQRHPAATVDLHRRQQPALEHQLSSPCLTWSSERGLAALSLVVDVSMVLAISLTCQSGGGMAGDTPRWRGRQLPTREQLEVWREFIETAEALRSELASRLQGESTLSLGDYAVLLALSEAPGGRKRSSDLAAHIGWERSRLSHHLGRMERRG